MSKKFFIFYNHIYSTTENEIISKESIENFVQNLAIARQGVKDYFDKIIKLEDSSYSIKVVFYLFVATYIFSIFSDKFLLWLILNLFILYAPLNKKYPDFLFNIWMKCKQVVEGVLGIIECLLPAYEEPKEEDGAEKK